MSQSMSRRALWMQKIADQISHSLTERIADGTLSPGDYAGSRDDLAAEFITSGSVVDRAIEALVDEGCLVEGPDGGFVVAEPMGGENAFELPKGETLADVRAILEMRLGLEAVGAALAAERRTDAELDVIRLAKEAYEQAAKRGEGAAQADFRFHHAIAAASGNQYLSDLLNHLGPLLIPRMRLSLPRGPEAGRDEHLQRSVRQHRAIYDKIEAKDSDNARILMREHLLSALELIDTMSVD